MLANAAGSQSLWAQTRSNLIAFGDLGGWGTWTLLLLSDLEQFQWVGVGH